MEINGLNSVSLQLIKTYTYTIEGSMTGPRAKPYLPDWVEFCSIYYYDLDRCGLSDIA